MLFRDQEPYHYSHDSDCKDDPDLGSYIWPGHDTGYKMTRKALDAVYEEPLSDNVSFLLKAWFHDDSRDTVRQLKGVFNRLAEGFYDEFEYDCDHDCPSGEYAEADGDIRLCVNNLIDDGYTKADTARLIMHEMYHRKYGETDPHYWCISDGKCSASKCGHLSTEELLNNAPDSYACFAQSLWV
jgi:hypothetical protein